MYWNIELKWGVVCVVVDIMLSDIVVFWYCVWVGIGFIICGVY